jgi:hypothetical protein
MARFREPADWARGTRLVLIFLLLALTSLLYGLGVVPLGSRGWSMLSVALVVGGPFLVYVPEWLLGRYRTRTT